MRGDCSKTNDNYDRPQVSLMDIQNLLNWVEVTKKSIYVVVSSHTCFFAMLMRLGNKIKLRELTAKCLDPVQYSRTAFGGNLE